jgi:hypothetical protein
VQGDDEMTIELVKETVAANPNPENPEDVSQKTSTETKTFYNAEELESLHPTAIDVERVDPAVRPIVERTIKEYKLLQGDYTKKTQELADLKKVPEPETYFEDSRKDGVFKDYLKNPIKVVGDINSELSRLESIIPDDGVEQYRQARKEIAYWNGIKDEFSIRRTEVSERQRELLSADEILNKELGPDASAIIEHAKSLGVTEKEFKSKPAIRALVKKDYAIANATRTTVNKEIKPKPQATATTSGEAGGGAGGGNNEEDETKLPVIERIKRAEVRAGYR